MTKTSLTAKVLFLTFLTFALLQVSCSRGVIDSAQVGINTQTGSNNIYRTYELAFNEQTGQSAFNAVFSVGGEYGTYVRLTPPSQLLINQRPASEHSITDGGPGSKIAAFYAGFICPIFWLFMIDQSSTTYSSFLSPSERTALISWTDQTGRNILDMISADPIAVQMPRTLRRGQNLTVNTQAGRAYDEIYVRVVGAHGDQSSRHSSRYGSTAEIPFTELDLLPRGPVTVNIEGSRRQTLSPQGSVGGHSTVVYRQTPQQILLVD